MRRTRLGAVVVLQALVGAAAAAGPPLQTSFDEGRVVIRTADDSFWLSPGGRIQIDAYATMPAGPSTQVLMRRIRPELSGGLFDNRLEFTLSGEFARGGAVADAWVRIRLMPGLFVQAGKANVPFGLEHQVSDRYIGFIERSTVTRNLGAGAKQPHIQLMGWDANARITGQLGIFMPNTQGDVDDRFPLDVMGRGTLRPFGPGSLERVQLGGSLSLESPRGGPWLGGVNREGAGWLRSPSGWTFAPDAFAGADGKGTEIGLVPRGGQRFAAELAAPIGRVEVRAEGMFVNLSAEERVRDVVVRGGGSFSGWGAVASLGVWVTGPVDPLPEGLVPKPSQRNATLQSKPSLQVLVRGERLTTRYTAGSATGPTLLGGSTLAPAVEMWVGAAQANLWWGPHLRLSAGATVYGFDPSQVRTPEPGQSGMVEFNSRVAVAL